MQSLGFLSYAHSDDTNSNGRLLEIAVDLRKEFQLLTSYPLRLFVDRESSEDGLRWGDVWRQVLDSRLEETAFFIPVLSPAYFASAECRREFMEFRSALRSEADARLVLPILFVSLRPDDAKGDELAQYAKERQWVDWTALRLEDRFSAVSKKAVNQMAQRLVEVQRSIDYTHPDDGPERQAALFSEELISCDSDTPGVIERVAEAEGAIEKLAVTLGAMTNAIDAVNQTVADAATPLAKAGSFKEKLRLTQLLAARISPHATECLQHAQEFAREMVTANPGTIDLIEAARSVIDSNDGDSERKSQMRQFLDTVAAASKQMLVMVETAKSASPVFAPIEGQSRELRPSITKLRKAFDLVAGLEGVLVGWHAAANRDE